MAIDPYASAKPYFRGAPNWIANKEDQDRIRAYDLYEGIYWSIPESFKIQQRGQDSMPIYMPSGKKIVETTNRFLAVDWGFLIDPADEAMQVFVQSLFKRENMYSKFATQKRYGLVRGDALWHVRADPKKPQGSRLSLHELDPRHYFPISDPEDLQKVVGCHLVQVIPTPPGTTSSAPSVVRRQTYRKIVEGDRTIVTSELGLFEIDKWDDRFLQADGNPPEIKRVKTIIDEFALEPEITHLPVYHIPNARIPSQIFGASELRGIERVIGAVNQGISDEELTLAMQGLGIWVTDSGPPLNDAGQEQDWALGPGMVTEVADGKYFKNEAGVKSVTPMLDHVRFMLSETDSAMGISDVAAGRADVSVAESGIALLLQLSPILAKNAEKEQDMLGIYDQMFYDLVHGWLPAYEGMSLNEAASMVAVVGDPVPVNKDAEIQRVLNLVGAGIMSVSEARDQLRKLGIELAPGMGTLEAEAEAEARRSDPFGARLEDEAENTGNGLVPDGTTIKLTT